MTIQKRWATIIIIDQIFKNQPEFVVIYTYSEHFEESIWLSNKVKKSFVNILKNLKFLRDLMKNLGHLSLHEVAKHYDATPADVNSDVFPYQRFYIDKNCNCQM